MKRLVLVAAISAALSTATASAAETYTLDSRHTFPSFGVSSFSVQ